MTKTDELQFNMYLTETPPPPPKPVLPKEELPKQLHVTCLNMHVAENTENHR